jgi:hypothetical protein
MYSFTRSSTEGKRFDLVVGGGTGIILFIFPCLNLLSPFTSEDEDHDVWDELLLPVDVDLVLVVFRAEDSSFIFANELHHHNVLNTTADAILARTIIFIQRRASIVVVVLLWLCYLFCIVYRNNSEWLVTSKREGVFTTGTLDHDEREGVSTRIDS